MTGPLIALAQHFAKEESVDPPPELVSFCGDLLRLGLRFTTPQEFAALTRTEFVALAAAARAEASEEWDETALLETLAQAGLDALARRDT